MKQVWPRILNPLERLNIVFMGIRAAVTGQWEGYERNRLRRRPAARLESSDSGLDYRVRESLIAEARALEQTFPIARRIRRKYSSYCVGNCRIRWNTGDKKIDEIYAANWMNWMNIADVNGVHRFPKLAKIVVGSTICDGDIFAQQVDSSGWGQLRLIEGDRVSSHGNWNSDSDANPKMIGGIGLSQDGRHVFIRVWERDGYGNFKNSTDLPSRNYKQMFDPSRADAYRGVTAYHAVLNSLRDMKETTQAEITAAKVNSKLAILVRTLTGHAYIGEDLLNSGDSSDTGAEKKSAEINDGLIKYMFPAEDISAHSSDRPSPAWIGLMEFLVRNIAIGTDLPYGVLWNMAGLGGPAARFEIQSAMRTISDFQDELDARFIHPIAGWVTAKDSKAGRIPFNSKWWAFKVQRPPYLTIDLGRDSKAGIEENKMALLSASDWMAESGQEFEEETEQMFKEEKFRMEMAKKYDVPIERVRIINPNQQNPTGDQTNVSQTGAP